MRAALFLLGFGVTVAFVPGWIDSATVTRWAWLAVIVPLLLFAMPEYRRLSFPLAAVLIACAALPGWASTDHLYAVEAFAHMLILIGALCLGIRAPDLRPVWMGLLAGVFLNGLIATAQWLGFDFIPQLAPPSGLFMNRNVLAEAGAVGCVIALCMRQWWFLPGTAMALLLPASRGAMGATILVLLILLLRERPRLVAISVILLGALAASVLFNGANLSGVARLEIWQAAIDNTYLLGHGPGGFMLAMPVTEYAHNDVIQYVFELGLFAVPYFLAFALALETRHDPTARNVLLCVLAMGLFSFPLYMPVTAFAAFLATGHLLAGRYGIRGADALATGGSGGGSEQDTADAAGYGAGHAARREHLASVAAHAGLAQRAAVTAAGKR